ncbi:hypothetical protein HK405_011821 [Cladochytrium tenue]|nr:hypothetical protein HK405_011821 [Cladochytrium tenue]
MSTTSVTLKPDTLFGGGHYNLLYDIEHRLRNFQPAVAIEQQVFFGAVVEREFNALRKREKAAAESVALIEKAAAEKVAFSEKAVAACEKAVAASEKAVAASEKAVAASEKAAAERVAITEKIAAEKVSFSEKAVAASEKAAAERVALIEKIAAEKVALSEKAVAAIENAAAARVKAAVELVALSEKAVAANEATIAAIKEGNAKEVELLEKDLRMTRNQLLYLERKLTGRYIIKKFEEANEIEVKKNTRVEAWKEFLDKIEGTELHKTIIKCVEVGAVAVGESVELDEQTSDLNLRAARLASRAYAALSARVHLHDDYESYHLPSSVPWSIICLMRSISSASGLRYQRVIVLGDEDTD